jgi:hypothetical protein
LRTIAGLATEEADRKRCLSVRHYMCRVSCVVSRKGDCCLRGKHAVARGDKDALSSRFRARPRAFHFAPVLGLALPACNSSQAPPPNDARFF